MGPGGDKPLVLVVDDDEDGGVTYAGYLELRGYRVHIAPDAPTAIRKARAPLPAVVLMDLSLSGSGVDGFEATRGLEADPTTKAIPVIASSGHAGAMVAHKSTATDAMACRRNRQAPRVRSRGM